MNVLVINHYSCNKGDRAILYFIARELDRNGVSRITISTHDRRYWQGDTSRLQGNPDFVPWGWNTENPNVTGRLTDLKRKGRAILWRFSYSSIRRRLLKGSKIGFNRFLANHEFLKALEQSDLVVSTGGHHITTLLSRDAVSEQLYDMALAVLSGKPVVLWSQSIGPLNFHDPQNKLFVAELVRRMAEILVRDHQSKDVLQFVGFDRLAIKETCETVIGLNDLFPNYVLPSRRAQVMGVAIYSAQRRPPTEHMRYVEIISNLISLASLSGYKVKLFPMELKNSGSDDRKMIYEIANQVNRPDFVQVIEEDMDTPTHLFEISRCRIFVGHKTHSVIFALTAGTPLIALAYHTKTEDFMNQYGQSEFCLPDRELELGRISQLFENLNVRIDDVGNCIFDKSRELGAKVRSYFAELINRHREIEFS